MAKGKRQTESQRIGESGQNICATLLPKGWIVQRIVPDFGEDFRIQLVTEEGELSGAKIYAQVKTKAKLKGNAKKISIKVEADDIAQWIKPENQDVLFLIAIDETKKEGYWLFLRKYLNDNASWKNKKKPTIPIPRENRLDDVTKFKDAVAKAIRYIKVQQSIPLEDMVDEHVKKLKMIEPRFNYALSFDGKNQLTHLSAIEIVKINLEVVTSDDEVKRKYTQEMLGKGLPVSFLPGEIKITGSPIFEKIFDEGGTLQMRKQKPASISLRAYQDSMILKELAAIPGIFSGGIDELIFNSTLDNAPISITVTHKHSTLELNFATKFNFSVWEHRRISDARMFRSLVPFIACLNIATHIAVIYSMDGESFEAYQIPVTPENNGFTKVDFTDLDQLLVVSQHHKINPIAFELAMEERLHLRILYGLIMNKEHSEPIGNKFSWKVASSREETQGILSTFAKMPQNILFILDKEFTVANEKILLTDLATTITNVKLKDYEQHCIDISTTDKQQFELIIESTDDSVSYVCHAADHPCPPKRNEIMTK